MIFFSEDKSPNIIPYFLPGKILFLTCIFFCCLTGQVEAQKKDTNAEVEILLSRLDLNSKGLEKVKEASGNLEDAAGELLKYYKQRVGVQHPIDRTLKSGSRDKAASEKDFTIADDALKHIFVGQPAYPSFFCGDDINWGTRPVPDNEWVWQLNRMSFWEAMGRVYWHTGDEKYAKAWASQLLDWTRKNPNDEEHKYAWRSIEAGIRGYRWSGLFQRFIDSPEFTPEVLVAFLNSCYDHATFLMTKYTTRSNWGLMEAEGMAFIAMTFPEFTDAEKWRTEAFRRLNNEINLQVYSDGHQRELAIGYHLGCIGWFFRTYELARMNGIENAFPDSYLGMIERMCEVPMKICLPNGTNVQFGDAWEGNPGQHEKRFREWAEFFGRDDFRFLSTAGKEGVQPDATAFALPVSGIYSMRSGWEKDAVCMVLKCGPDGGGHCQPDNGTFDLYAGERNLMPDGGSYIYSGNPEGRAWFRQTKVHQTLTLDNKNSRYHPRLLKWEPGDSLDVLIVENDSYENLTHRRTVLFVNKKYFIVVDDAYGAAIGDVAIHFQLAPGSGNAGFNNANMSVRSNFNGGWNVFVRTNFQEGIILEEEEGWVSFKYTIKEPRPAFSYRLRKESANKPVRFITLVAPFEDKEPDVIVNAVEEKNSASSSLRLEIIEKGKKKYIDYSLKTTE